MKLPNFLIVGAAKSGTTSLYYYLKAHPEIYLPEVKELRFFSQMPDDYRGPKDDVMVNRWVVRTFEEYSSYYKDVPEDKKAIGDVSPDYLYFYKTSIKNIKKYLGTPRIIIILRNPVERAFSQYLYFVKDGREKLSFADAIRAEKERKNKHWEWAWSYVDVGFYYKQVKAYLENFDKVAVYLFEDLKNNPPGLLRNLYTFLEVSSDFVPSNIGEKYNVSGIPRNRLLHYFLTTDNFAKKSLEPVVKIMFPHKIRRKVIDKIIQKNLKKPQMSPETREYLKRIYREDILKLQDLIKRDLSHWLK